MADCYNSGMFKKSTKYLTLITAVIIAIVSRSSDPAPRLIIFSVGQGDAIFIAAPNGLKILIDGGPDKQIMSKLDKELGFWQRHLDIMVLTHNHADHKIGWLAAIRRYRPKLIILSPAETIALASEIRPISQATTKISGLTEDIDFNLGSGCRLKLWPPPHPTQAPNSHSIISKLDCPNGSWLGAGDLETVDERYLLASRRDLKAQIFKASHHGADSANSPEFLRSIAPQTVVISVGAGNRYGHPGLKLLALLKDRHLKILRTDKNGDIVWKFSKAPP